MAAASAQTVRHRIEAICATIPGIVGVLDGTESDITDLMLPAVRVLSRAADGRASRSRQNRKVPRTYRILLYVKLISKHENQLYEQQPDVDAAEAWLDVIPDYFFTNAPRLELNNSSLIGVDEVGEMSGDEPAIAQWIGKTYTVIPHDLTVTTERS